MKRKLNILITVCIILLLYKCKWIISNQDVTSTTAIIEKIAEDKIVNPHNFDYIYNPGEAICGSNHGADLFLLVYVHSSPVNYKKRLAIRETWTKRSMFPKMRVVFMMGRLAPVQTENTKTAALIEYEYGLYGDIVQEDFIDTYRNLTYKGIMSLKWISNYCSSVKYILKVDDDIIVNTFLLWRHLRALDNYKILPTKCIMCNVWTSMKVIRDSSSKWYLSKEEFKPDYFSKYCSGSAFILTPDLAKAMFNVSFYVKFFWVDDYYISGLLARASNATYKHLNSLYIINSGLVEQRFKSKEFDYTVFGHLPTSINKLYSLWRLILRNELIRFPVLSRNLTQDFVFLKDLKWTNPSFWVPYLDYDP